MTAGTVYTPGSLNIAHGMALEEDAARNAPPPDPRVAEREQDAARLVSLVEVLRENPAIPMPAAIYEREVRMNFWGDDATARANLAAAARAFRPCNWTKRTWEYEKDGSAYFEMAGDWQGWRIVLTARREAVCTRVVKGTEDRPVEEVITPAVTKTVMKPTEIVEWVCEPVMTPAAEAAAETSAVA